MQTIVWTAKRLGAALITLLGVSLLVFSATRFLPGSYSDAVLGPLATPTQKAELTAKYGLDQSVMVQYLRWLGAAVHGDFGTSLVTHQSVATEFGLRIPVTVTITLMALAIAMIAGIPLGVYAGTHTRAGIQGSFGRLVSVLGISLPEFVAGSLVLFLFSRYALGFHIGNFVPVTESFGAGLASATLPAIVLALFCLAATARTTRDAVLNVLVEPHIAASVARGETASFIIRHHILRNAAVPVLTLTATITAYLLGGAVIVETVFNAPGLGSYLVAALNRRDYAIIQAGVLLAAAVFVTMSFLVDVITGLIDPRVSIVTGGQK
ncbi:ABC transporter permease [Rhodococcus qingshengii]|uniref:ABC transporter permease n=1 Tax=Rhodococcus qingshengii TaxID=334542 RepID=UPI0036DACA2A